MDGRRRIQALYEGFLKKAPKQSRSRQLVDSVLEAAVDLVSRDDGETKVTVQEVAARAGVGVGSLYDWFEDRGSMLSGVAARVTAQNLERFEAKLAGLHELPLEDAVQTVIDFAFETYVARARTSRAVLRIAHRIGLMPTLAESQAVFAASLAEMLRARDDVRTDGIEAAAWLVTNMTMGVVHTLVWSEHPDIGVDVIRAELVRAAVVYLRR